MDNYEELEKYLMDKGFPSEFTCENCGHDVSTFGSMERICMTYDEDGLDALEDLMVDEDFSTDCGTCNFWYYPEQTDPQVVVKIKEDVAEFIDTKRNEG